MYARFSTVRITEPQDKHFFIAHIHAMIIEFIAAFKNTNRITMF